MGVTFRIVRNDIPRVQTSIAGKSVDAVRESVHYMRDYAQSIAPVQTGAFRSSLYVNGPGQESDYASAASKAHELRPRAVIVPELQAAQWDPNASRLRSNMGRFTPPEAIMGSAVDYSLFLEEGVPPRPTFRQSALVAEVRFIKLMKDVADV